MKVLISTIGNNKENHNLIQSENRMSVSLYSTPFVLLEHNCLFFG